MPPGPVAPAPVVLPLPRAPPLRPRPAQHASVSGSAGSSAGRLSTGARAALDQVSGADQVVAVAHVRLAIPEVPTAREPWARVPPERQTRWNDCEDRVRSLMVMGCGLVTAGVTPGKTGFVPCCDMSARCRRPRPGWRSWPDQELDHLALVAPGVSHHSPAEPPSRTGTTSRPAKERTHEQSDRFA